MPGRSAALGGDYCLCLLLRGSSLATCLNFFFLSSECHSREDGPTVGLAASTGVSLYGLALLPGSAAPEISDPRPPPLPEFQESTLSWSWKSPLPP